MNVDGTITLTCNNCNKQHDIDAEDAYFDHTSTNENPQGAEFVYEWEHDFECDGNNNTCGNHIEIIYGVWEYPEGIFNHAEPEVQGASLQGSYSFDFAEEPELDDIE